MLDFKYKKMTIEINIPDNGYCWDGQRSCEFFNNEGGSPRCTLEPLLDGPDKYDKQGIVPMPEQCKNLCREK